MGKWQQIFEHEIASHSDKLPDAPGIYRVRLLEKGRKPVKIKRLYGTDTHGILMIGSTKNLRKRLTQFVDACKGKRGHSEGTKLWMAGCFRPSWFRGKELLLEYRVEKSEEAAKCSEAEEIRRYVKKYLEPPPLNGTIPTREKWVEELKGELADRFG